jgi:O-antigen/teichoic acid export membrane protein
MHNHNQNEDINKIAFKAGGWYVFSSVMLGAMNAITTPIFTRLMSTKEFGVTSTFSTWVSLLVCFCTLNMTYSIGRAKLDFPNKLDEYIGSIQLLSLIISSLLGAFMVMLRNPLSKVMELPSICIVFMAIQLISLPTIRFYQSGVRYRYRYRENIAIGWYTSIANVVLSLILILTIKNYRAELKLLGEVVPTFLLALVLVGKATRNGSLRCNQEYWKYAVSVSVPLVFHEISLNILNQSDRIFIMKICGASDTGVYSIAYNYGCLMSVITTAISNGWLPWFHDKYYAKEYETIKKNSKLIAALGCYIGLACIALAPEAIAILGGASYQRGIYCVAPVTLGIVCKYIYTNYVNIEMHLKKTRFVPIGTMIAAVLNMMLNMVFIPIYGFVAASYTTFASYLVLMVVHYVYSRLVLGIKLYDDKFMFGAVIVTYLIAVLLVFTYNHTILRYALLLVGFISFLLVYKDFIKNRCNWMRKEKWRGL